MIPKLNEYKKRWAVKSDSSIKPGLDAVEAALQVLGHPEKSLRVIHVSGTNGKGSTIHLMEAILRTHGFTTGSFTSPAIKDLHDQIQYNNKPATKDMIDRAFQQLHEHNLSDSLTDFELLTVIAFLVLKELRPDYVLVETGMGGLLDSTNVVTPIVSVITSIALDHTGFLGETIEAITRHKAGIIKKNVPVVSGDLPTEALKVVQQIANEKSARLYRYGPDFLIRQNDRETFEGAITFPIPQRKMQGPHQRINSSVAIEALAVAGIDLQTRLIQQALENTQLSYRFEEILPGVFLDGAHNPAAARALRETIEEAFPGERIDFVVGMLKRKDIRGTLNELIPVAQSFTFIEFDHPEAATVDDLLRDCAFNRRKVTNLMDGSIVLSKEGGRRIVVTGSLYLLADLTFQLAD